MAVKSTELDKDPQWHNVALSLPRIILAQLSYLSLAGGLLLIFCGSYVFGKFIIIGISLFSIMTPYYIIIDSVPAFGFICLVLFLTLIPQVFLIARYFNKFGQREARKFSDMSTFFMQARRAGIAILAILMAILTAWVYSDSFGIFGSMLMFCAAAGILTALYFLRTLRRYQVGSGKWLANLCGTAILGIVSPAILLCFFGYVSALKTVVEFDDITSYVVLKDSDVKIIPLIISEDYFIVFDGTNFIVFPESRLAEMIIVRNFDRVRPSGHFDRFLDSFIGKEV